MARDDVGRLLELFGGAPDDPSERLGVELAAADDRLVDDLVAMRRAKGLRQSDVAARMGRDQAAVSNFERLGADPHLSTVRRYARAVGARIEHRVTDSASRADTSECIGTWTGHDRATSAGRVYPLAFV